MGDDCAFVTHALDEQNVEKALVLGKSLQRVLTRFKLVCIVRPTISLTLRDALETTFDFVISLDHGKCVHFEEEKISSNTLAKCFALSFTFFKQCVYIPPNSLVLKNCDEVFSGRPSKTQNPASGIIAEAKNQETIYFQPSRQAFKNLVAHVAAAKLDIDTDAILEKWVQNQAHDTLEFLQEPYSVAVKLTENRLMKNDDSISVCVLPDLPAKIIPSDWENGFFGKAGLLEQFIYKYWLSIYKDEVKISIPINDCDSECLNSPHLDNKAPNSNLEPIAVVGMSCRFPSSNNVAEFWNLLIEKRDGITNPPEYRWTKEQSISSNPETRKTQAGFLTVPVDEFDAKFFGISPKEIIFIDPQHRLLHELVWEALEDGAIDPMDLNGTRTGVFMGSWRNDYYDILQRSSSKEFYRGYMGNSIGAGAARISHFLGLTGPCVATESGCSAAMVAVHMACRSLQNGESNMALACGVNLLLHPFTTDIMPMVCAPDGHCKSFSNNADGFGRAEGCAVLVLKRLSDAVKDGDNICGVIKGSAMAQEGLSKSMGTPTIHCEAQAMRDALREANVHPSQVSYVESHGTGTIVGDPMEVAAIGRVYAEGRQEPLVIGSVKTNVGHTESCSGLTAIMKVLLSMKNEVIPPHRNYKELNPDINLDIIPAKLPLEPVKWPKIPGKPRVAGVSSFGITGTDSHVIVQEPPEVTNQRIVLKDFERPLHLMTVSARTEEALDILIEKYKSMLSSEDSLKFEESFANMAYTTNVGRAKFNWRAAIVAKDQDDALKILETNKMLRGEVISEETTSKKVCFLFTGQGSQYHGMAKELYETSPVFQMHFNRCQEILKTQHKIDLANAFWGKDENLINRTLYSQTGIFVVEYCLVKLWESWGVKPDYVLGHSLGEFGAAVCAGILTLEEALTLVAERSRLIDELPQGKMLVVKADKSNVDNLLRKFTSETKESEAEHPLDYAAINSAEQTVLAGDSEKIERLAEWLKGKDVKCSVLQSSHAFHSRHMDPILEEYGGIAKRIFKNKKITDLSCSYVSGMLGKIVDVSSSPVDWPEYWVQHTREKVNFLSASKAVCDEAECRIFVEVGPHPVLTAFTMMNNEGKKQMMCLPSLRKKETDWSCLLNTVGKLFTSGSVEIDWKRFDQFYDRKKVGSSLPTYPFQGTKFWPNISSSSGVQIHPLLGSSVPNPTKAKIFQNSVSLQSVEYLKDHVIGSMAVFPGAGYMETLLMAGHVTLDGASTDFRHPRKPIQLEGFRIEAPLGLDENSGCACQTVVEWSSAGDTTTGLEAVFYHEMKDGEEGTSKWVKHASATFSPYNPSHDVVNIEDKQSYLDTMEKLKSTGKLENSSKDFYDKVADVGLKFGPAFRTLSKVWRGEDSIPEFLAEVKIPKDAGSYLVHPTLIDAMIQATVFHGEKSKKIEKKLRVPIGCERFVWFSPLKVSEATEDDANDEQNVCYIYSKGDSQTVVLLDKDGNLVAALNKLEAIETNAKSVQALLESQVKAVPDLYKVDWKSTLGPRQLSLSLDEVTDLVDVTDSEPDDVSNYSEDILEVRRSLDILVTNYVQIAFLNLGWAPRLNDKVELDSFLTKTGIQQQHRQLIRQFFRFLEKEDVLMGKTDKDCWTVKNLPESQDSLQRANEEIVHRLSSTQEADQVLLVRNVGQSLEKILTGKESALRVLFPEDETKPSAGKFYDSSLKKFHEIMHQSLCKVWASIKRAYEGKTLPVIRILEVGAGTGSITETILHSLETHGMHYEYIYSDISSSFFLAAEKRFKKYRKNMKFRKLNLEQDATTQGFAPKYFDFVVAVQVIHATRDIKETCLNVRQLMKDGGNLMLCEMVEAIRRVDFIFGLLDGYWRFTDKELRTSHATLTIDQWDQVGKLTGFSKMAISQDFEYATISFRADGGENSSYDQLYKSLNENSQTIQRKSRVAWLIFYGDKEELYVNELKNRLEYLGRKTVILVKHANEQDISQTGNEGPLKLKYKIRPGNNKDMDDLITTIHHSNRETDPNGFSLIEGVLVTWGLCDANNRDQTQVAKPFLYLIQNLLKMEKKLLPQVVLLTAGQYGLGDILCKNPSPSTLLGISKCVANEHSELRIRGIDVSPFELDTSIDEVFQEIFTAFNEEVAHFCAFRKGERFIPKIFPEKAILKGGGALPLPPSTQRFQLIHPKSKAIQDLEFGDLELFTLKPNEIEVQVKCSALNFKDILNILKPIEEFKDSNGVGFDFAGVVTAVGDAVTKRKIGDPVFGINIMGNALPSHIKLPEDAVASVPDSCTFTEAACFPAVFSTAYYCIINIAKAKKGDTLLIHTASGGVGLLAIQIAKYFGLKIICTAGSERKRAYLRSLGVEHVFHSRNTSYGEEIIKATNGRGVDIVLNSLTGPGFKEATLQACAKGARFVEMSKLNIWTEDEVAQRRPDIQYTIIDLTKLDEDSSRKLLTESQQLLEEGVISPIPFTRYDAQNIRQALTYLQKAQHIGKVVVTMPESKPGSAEVNQVYTPLFNERSTYLITGGLGGVGLEVCKYMVEQGARNIVLVGRKAPNEKAADVIGNLNGNRGCNVVVFQGDVGDWTQCQAIFQKMKDPSYNLPPLRGIMHCAGALADALIENSKWEDFMSTYQAKVNGSWNLHELTKDTILEHFVLFSSIVAPFGSPGQSTHVSACTFEDTMALYRNSHGLPAISINWGQFGQVGIAAEADIIAIRPFSAQQGINALDLVLRGNRNHLIVATFDDTLAAVVKYFPYSKRVIDEQVFKMTGNGNGASKKLLLNSAAFWEEYNDSNNDRDGKVEVVKKFTKRLLRHVLRLDEDEPIDENMDLQDMGVDSLMMLELKNHLQEVLGDRVTLTQSAMKDCNTVLRLADRLVQIIEEEGEFTSVKPPTLEEVKELVVEDIKLPSEIQAQHPGSQKLPSEIKVVLFTGATGILGSHLLREMLEERPQLETVYCLVRSRGGQSPQEKLTTVLERTLLMGKMKHFNKVQCISGNFIEDKLGMSDDDYERLVNEVDAVVHCGAKVSHVEFYRNVNGGRSDARSVNVGGIKKILKFCATSRTKHLLNTSTLLAITDVKAEDETLSESWPDREDLSVAHNRGYQTSKYVCDLLLGQATLERGIPCKSFRFAELRGSRVTGQSLLEHSHFMRGYLFFLKEGIMPTLPIASNFLPIDLAAKITCRIMFNDEAPNEAYNVSHPQPQLVQEYLPKLAKELGHTIEILDVEEYRKRALEKIADEEQNGKSSLLSEFKDLYADEDTMNFLFGGASPAVRKSFENVENFWLSKRLLKYVPDLYDNDKVESSYEINKRDFLTGKSDGLFEKLGL